MKTTAKKLVLAKETMRRLDDGHLRKVQGEAGTWTASEFVGCYSRQLPDTCPSRLC
jgi:hypothetical protein